LTSRRADTLLSVDKCTIRGKIPKKEEDFILMDTDTQAKLAGIKKQLEEIAGRKIDAGAEQLLTRNFSIASSTYLTNTTVNVWVTNERIFPAALSCADSALVDTSGVTETGADGIVVFRLRNFLCDRIFGANVSFEEPINVLATPQGAIPNYVTMTHGLIKDPNLPFFTDVEITAFSWSPGGAAAPNVRFYWRCRVVGNSIVDG
jgi:hypothetical protein